MERETDQRIISNLKILGKHTIIYSFSATMTALVGIVLVPILTRIFSPAEYGTIDLILTVIPFLATILMMGFDSSVASHFYQITDKRERKKIISTALYSLLFVSLTVIGGLGFFTETLSRFILKGTMYSFIFSLPLLIIFFTLLDQFFGSLSRIHLKPLVYLSLVSTRILLTIGLSLFFLFTTQLKIEAVLYGYLGAAIVSSLVGFISTFPNYVLSFSCALLKSLLTSGFPLILVTVFNLILYVGGRIFLIHFLGLEELGIYSVGVKISQVLLLIMGGLQLGFLPFTFSIHKKRGAKKTFAKVLTYFIAIACTLALIITLFAKETIALISSPQYLEAFKVVGPLSLAMVAYGSYFVVSLGLHLAKKTSYIAWASGISALSTIVLNFIMVPHFGMMGAALATTFSYCILSYLLYLASQWYYPIPFETKKVVFVLILTVLLMMISLQISFPNAMVNLLIKSLMIGAFLILLLISNTINKREVLLIFYTVKNLKAFIPRSTI